MKTRAERYDYWCIQKGMLRPNELDCLRGLGHYMFLIECIEPTFDDAENPTIMKCESIDMNTASIHCNIFNKNFELEYDPIEDTMYYKKKNVK